MCESEYKQIEDGVPTIENQLTVSVQDNGEGLIDLQKLSAFRCSFHNSGEMIELIGEKMLLRESVVRLLMEANTLLAKENSQLQFEVFYAYRAREVQEKYWKRACEKFREELNTDDIELISAAAQRLSADPRVAGHPTGGSVDLTLYDTERNEYVDMGVELNRDAIYRAGKKIYTMSPEVSDEVIQNRLLLRKIMVEVGFTAFDPEFWHFDYGNREWAFNTNTPESIYKALPLQEALQRIL